MEEEEEMGGGGGGVGEGAQGLSRELPYIVHSFMYGSGAHITQCGIASAQLMYEGTNVSKHVNPSLSAICYIRYPP